MNDTQINKVLDFTFSCTDECFWGCLGEGHLEIRSQGLSRAAMVKDNGG